MRIQIKHILAAALTLLEVHALASGNSSELDYEIVALLDMSKHVISACAHLTIPADACVAPNEVHLGARSAGDDKQGKPLLKIERITSAAGEELHYTSDIPSDTVIVTYPNAIHDSAAMAIDIYYTISLLDDAASWKKGFEYFIFSSTAYGDRWYPTVLAPDPRSIRFCDFRVRLTYPAEGVAILTTGELRGEPQKQGENLSANFVARHVEGFALNIGEGYATENIDRDGFRVVIFAPPELVDTYRQAAELTAEAVDWYRQTYGFFPSAQIGIAAGNTRWGGGYPASNLFYIHRRNLEVDFIRWITSHELGHYYWGLYVLSAGNERNLDWLMLANGIWIDQLYIAQAMGRTLEQQWRNIGYGDWYVDFIQAEVSNYDQRLGIAAAEVQDLHFDYNSLVRHGKGAVGLFLQTRRLGFDRFLELQRRLLEEYRYKSLSPEEFIRHFEDTGASWVRQFFRQWQRGDASIGFDIAAIEMEQRQDSLVYKISVERTGTVQYPVALEAEDSRGMLRRHELSGEAAEEQVTLVLQDSLLEVRLDPDGVLPMWNSSHHEMQRLHLIALERAGLTRPFLVLAKQYLDLHPEDDEVKRLAVKKQWLGR